MKNGSPLDAAIKRGRAKRHALAGSIRSAQLDLDRTPVSTSTSKEAIHEVSALQRALEVLLEQPPEPRPSRETQALERELELIK